MERRLDADKKHDIICAAFQQNTEQVGKIRELVHSLVQQSQTSKLECLQSFLDDFEEADTLPRLEQRNIEWILRALEFEGMKARRQQVESSVGNTFKWIITKDAIPKGHRDLKVSFNKWLSDGTGVYHVTGKPGSGKSTLMKLIDQTAATQKQLESWASRTGERLIVARFYTWKAASAHRLQNQEEGLTRTLLHQILTAAPELTPVIFANHSCWAPHEYRLINILSQSQGISKKIHFEPKEVLAALEATLRIQGYRFFLLIDGMDEFEKAHSHHAIAKRVLRWSSSNLNRVKICVSSREDNAFMDRFSSDQRLRLHDVTRNDVHELVTTRLLEHDYFAEASTKDRQILVDEIVNRAEGVFLWVVLTIQELKLLLDDRQSFQAILQAVHELPKEMEDFFRETLSRIPAGYKKESMAVFSVVTSTLGRAGLLCLFHYSMLRRCIENDDPNIDKNPRSMSLDEIVSQIREFRSRLPSLCKGLLVTTRRPKIGIPYEYLGEDENYTIECNHRSVLDFLWKSVREIPATGEFDFHADTRGRTLAIRSAIEVIEAFPWNKAMATSYEDLLHIMLSNIELGTFPRTRLGDSIFPLLRTLDATLLRKQRVIEVITSFESTGLGDLRLDKDTVSIFAIAFRKDFCEYIDWALKNYPPWIWTEEAKSWAVSTLAYESEITFLPIRCLKENGWLSINEPLLANRTATPSFFPVQRGSIWVNFLISCMANKDDRAPPMSAFDLLRALSAGAEPRIRFNWCSQEGCPNSSLRSTRTADLVRMKPYSPDGIPSDQCRVQHHRDMPSCSRYEMTIEVGDAHELESIQVPEGPGEEHIRLIRLFVEHFGKPSGSVTFMELIEILTTSEGLNEDNLIFWREQDLIARACLKGIDDSLARVGSRKYFHYWQTVLISSLGKPRPCHC